MGEPPRLVRSGLGGATKVRRLASGRKATASKHSSMSPTSLTEEPLQPESIQDICPDCGVALGHEDGATRKAIRIAAAKPWGASALTAKTPTVNRGLARESE